MKEFCLICGYDNFDFQPWGEDKKTPTFSICPCCGVEFGYEDSTIESQEKYREKWINEGRKWFKPQLKPQNWNFEKQIRNIRELENK